MSATPDDRRQRLSTFFEQQETRAYKMAYAMTRNRDDALDIVQDSMLRLASRYADRDDGEWLLLFYRILNNRIRDFLRRRKLWRWLPGFGSQAAGREDEPQATEAPDAPPTDGPDGTLQQQQQLERIHQALGRLPLRQQQVFLLRAWQEFSTAETAGALGISEASVKTHYRRALQQLRLQLGNRTGVTA